MVGGNGGGCVLIAVGYVCCPFLEDSNFMGRRVSYSWMLILTMARNSCLSVVKVSFAN